MLDFLQGNLIATILIVVFAANGLLTLAVTVLEKIQDKLGKDTSGLSQTLAMIAGWIEAVLDAISANKEHKN